MNSTAGEATTREQTSCNEPRHKAIKFAPARTSEQFNARNLSRFAMSKRKFRIFENHDSYHGCNPSPGHVQTQPSNRIERTKMIFMIILVATNCPIASNNQLVNEKSGNVAQKHLSVADPSDPAFGQPDTRHQARVLRTNVKSEEREAPKPQRPHEWCRKVMNNTTGEATTHEQMPYNEPRRKAMKFAPARTSERFNARNLSRFALSKGNL